MNKPNLFIVGAAKSGTTSLYYYLKQHPDIYMSPIKEPHHFSKDLHLIENTKKKSSFDTQKYFDKKPLKEIHGATITKLNDYLKLFEEVVSEKVIGEASVGYLYSKVAANEIYNFNPNAKIIVILRNPVERTLSHYVRDLAIGRQTEHDILKAIKSDYETEDKGWGLTNHYIDLSLYYEQVKRYFDIFPKEQILVLYFSDFKLNTEEVLQNIFSFLDLQRNIIIDYSSRHNVTFLPKFNFPGLQQFGKFLPAWTKKTLKKIPFLYQSRTHVKVTNEVKEYINTVVKDDWERVQKLVKSNQVNFQKIRQ